MAALADRLYFKVLVVRCQAGDAAAFEELVSLCQPGLRGFLFKMLPSELSPDDVAQDVWMDVFRGLRKLNDPSTFLPWFYRIAHHRAYRALRDRGIPLSSIQEVQIDPEATEPEEFSAEEALAVHEAMDQLTREHREVLLLRFMQEMSYEEIAKVVECQIGTVRSRIHNAKRILREILEKTQLP